ncbi:enoyl-CoA hydratase/isomerase family protein [Halorubellus litoreus]|uniref:Enoyl-CoA hydratase/isomerase family protein n=1 Tax=Halorubellus litoreus TaxID=755308 RepID=A0ABD5VJX6_9EURY
MVRPAQKYVEGEYEHVQAEQVADVYRIAMDRPEKYNAWNHQLMAEMRSAFIDANQSDARVVVLTGNGKAFSAGGDFDDWEDEREDPHDWWNNEPGDFLYRSILDLRQPLIVRLNGVAAGGGAVIAGFGDIIIASEEARIGTTHVNVGLSVPTTSILWPHSMSLYKAKELLMTGELLDAEEAKEYGLVNHVVPHDELDAKVDEMIDKLASGPQYAIQYTKLVLNRWVEFSMTQFRGEANALEAMAASNPDHTEGVRAIIEDRDPEFPSARDDDD